MTGGPATTGPILELADVSVTFLARQGFLGSRSVTILRGVSLALTAGETLAVVGESGSGKTTLGRASLRLVPLTAGRLMFRGQDITDLPEGRLRPFRRDAQAIFQDPYSTLSPYMRVLDLVAEPLVVQGVGSSRDRRDRVLEALDQVRLRPAADLLERYPHTLSGGQRQRVNIARSMILEPAYVVADEPVSMIDASSRAEYLGLLRTFQEQRGVTYLYITHDLASARRFADRIAVMYLGRIVELADARELIDHPLHPYAQALLAAVPEPDPANRRRLRAVVTGEPPSVMAAPAGCSFHPRCPHMIPGTCDTIDPPLIQLGPRHQVACHLYPTPAEAMPTRELQAIPPPAAVEISALRAAGPCVDADRQQQDEPERDLLVERVEPEQVEAIADEGDEQAADHGPPDRALAAQDAGAADHDAGQHREGQEPAARRLGAEHPRGVEDARERRRRAAQREGGDPDASPRARHPGAPPRRCRPSRTRSARRWSG